MECMNCKVTFILLAVLAGCTRAPDMYEPLDWVHINGNTLFDSSGRTIILRGFVTLTHNGPGTDEVVYTINDYQKMKSMGANYQSIRLFAGWIGGWPGYTADDHYLEKLDHMVSLGKQVGMYSQFKLTMYDIKGMLTDTTLRDKTWGSFWRNENGEQDIVIAAWKTIWEHYKDEPAVIGYDILNEPCKGDFAVSDEDFILHLNTFYQKALDELQQINDHIGFIQPPLASPAVDKKTGAILYMPYTEPISRSVVYAPHFYVNVRMYDINNYSKLLEKYLNEAKIHNAPLIMGECGEFWDMTNDGDPGKEALIQNAENAQIDLFDHALIGFSRPWYSNDRVVGIGHAVIKGKTKALTGQERTFITDVIARVYPQRTAGHLYSFTFSQDTKHFSLVYEPHTGKTVIFIPRERHYKNGFIIKHTKGITLYYNPVSGSLEIIDNSGSIDVQRIIWNENASTLIIDEWLTKESVTLDIVPA